MNNLTTDMLRHRELKKTIADTIDLMLDPKLVNRVQYFGLEKLQKEARTLEIKLLVQVPDNFLKSLKEQTFLK
jgi:hypothetical protein